jgi:hypothetical protein
MLARRDKLMKNHAVLEVDLVHVREYNSELGDGLENRPAEFLPLVSSAVVLACGSTRAPSLAQLSDWLLPRSCCVPLTVCCAVSCAGHTV